MRSCTVRIPSFLVSVVIVFLLGCREETESPTGPEAGPALAATPSQGLLFSQVSAGHSSTCGVTPGKRAFCWGANDQGQLGDGGTSPGLPHSSPRAVVGGIRFHQVSEGSKHGCGVTLSGKAYCWGHNDLGQLGDGTTTDRFAPVAVAGGLRFHQVSASGNGDYSCGVATGHIAYCWGSNLNGQGGDGTIGSSHLTPVPVATTLLFSHVIAGGVHSCGVTLGNRAYCWGDNGFGQLGDGTLETHLKPVAVVGGLRFQQVDAAAIHTCGITLDNRAYCWGEGEFGQLGNGGTDNHSRPVAVAGGLRFLQVAAGENVHTCAVTLGLRAYCWGQNLFGQLGDGTTNDHLTPVAVAGALRFHEVTTGVYHTCGAATGKQAYCWGLNDWGQLGDGTTTNRSTPVAVGGSN